MDSGAALRETALSETGLSETGLSETGLSETEIALPRDMKARTLSFAENFTFMELPTEIRLIIYKELLVRNSRPELCFCLDDHHTAYNHAPKFYVHPAILGTCKTIYYEALPILYTENVFELLCVFGQLGKQCVWHRTCGTSPILACPTPHASIYLQEVFLTYTDFNCTLNHTGLGSDDIKQFARCWPRIEDEILELYPNIKSIFVQIRQQCFHSICIKLARRHQSSNAEAKRRPNYLAVLEEWDLSPTVRGRDSHPDQYIRLLIEDLCAAILHREKYGLMQGTIFGVQAVRWGSGFEKIRLSWEEFDICDIYLGCEQ